MKVEVCVTSVAGAKIAEGAGADRLELCTELAVGGVTPSQGLLQAVRDAVHIPVHVLIRPRSGNFTYEEEELSLMLSDIECCRRMGFEGIVTGCLTPDGRVDLAGMKLLTGASGDCHITFHRAFDRLKEWESSLGELEALGVHTILTSGRAPSAPEGIQLLEQLAGGTKCGIMPGGGIRPHNVQNFKGKGFQAIHLSALLPGQPEEFSGVLLNTPSLLREDQPIYPDPGLISEVIAQVREAPKKG